MDNILAPLQDAFEGQIVCSHHITPHHPCPALSHLARCIQSSSQCVHEASTASYLMAYLPNNAHLGLPWSTSSRTPQYSSPHTIRRKPPFHPIHPSSPPSKLRKDQHSPLTNPTLFSRYRHSVSSSATSTKTFISRYGQDWAGHCSLRWLLFRLGRSITGIRRSGLGGRLGRWVELGLLLMGLRLLEGI